MPNNFVTFLLCIIALSVCWAFKFVGILVVAVAGYYYYTKYLRKENKQLKNEQLKKQNKEEEK